MQDIGVSAQKLEAYYTQMTGKPIQVTPKTLPKVLAKIGSFKDITQVAQTLKEAKARFTLKQLQPRNITRGIV